MDTKIFMRVMVVVLVCSQATRTAPLKDENGCSHKVADVIFALDTSGSIWEEDFLQQLKFVEGVVKHFDIGLDKVRVGVITFGSKVHHQFHLNDYSKKSNLILAIQNVRYTGGGTNTGSAIAHARNVMFKSSNGGRDFTDKILIVVTDGFSRNTTQAALEASICRSLGMTLFSVGVGFGVDEFELKAIANRPKHPNEKFSFRVDDFSALDSIRSAFTTRACRAMSSYETQKDGSFIRENMKENVQKYCGGKPADIYFAVDASSSIMEHNFRKMLRFVNEVIELFDIGPNKTRIGVVLFSDGINPIIHLNNDYSRSELKRRIINAPYLRGGTRTGSTIHYIRNRGFSNALARRHVAQIVILLTDGQSKDMQRTIAEAKMAHRDGLYMFTIGIGDQVDKQELGAMSSAPTDDFMFEIDDFDALSSIKSILAIETCNAHDLQQDEQKCNLKNLDVMYIFDSYTLGPKKTNVIKDFIADVEQLTNIGDDADKIHSGVLTQSCGHNQDIPLARHSDSDDFLSSTSTSQSKGLHNLMRKLRHHGFRIHNGGRYESQNVAVLFVDGNLQEFSDIHMEARRMKFRNRIEIFIIAVGGLKTEKRLDTVCSEPVSEHLITVSNYTVLSAVKPSLLSKFCKDKYT